MESELVKNFAFCVEHVIYMLSVKLKKGINHLSSCSRPSAAALTQVPISVFLAAAAASGSSESTTSGMEQRSLADEDALEDQSAGDDGGGDESRFGGAPDEVASSGIPH